MPITLITRNAIVDGLRVRGTLWSGRFDQPTFLSRLYRLSEMPSTDPRYANAKGDVYCHTVNWPGDWDPLWVFTDARFELDCNDDKLLTFLAEMIHPVVRADADEVVELVGFFNGHLAKDGWQLIESDRISDRPVFKAARTGHVNPIAPVDVLDSAYVQRQISRMRDNVEKDPALAIGSSKELIETTCKTMLAKLGMHHDGDLPGLVRKTIDALRVEVSGAADPAKAKRAVERLLGSISGIGSAVGEVRNAVGTGHGHHAFVGDLDSTYSRLVVNASAALVTYLMDRYRSVTFMGAPNG